MLRDAPQMDPYSIADDTWIIPERFTAGPDALVSVKLDGGGRGGAGDRGHGWGPHRERWLRQAWSIVDPGDVRWIFISHDDQILAMAGG